MKDASSVFDMITGRVFKRHDDKETAFVYREKHRRPCLRCFLSIVILNEVKEPRMAARLPVPLSSRILRCAQNDKNIFAISQPFTPLLPRSLPVAARLPLLRAS